jgi:hypothetical protein
VHNPVGFLVRSTMRVARASAVLVTVSAGLLVVREGAAFAQTAGTTQAQPDAVTFGLLGPVGLAAVALGIVGMTAGVVRQRRKARAAAAEAAPVVAMAEATLADEPTRPALTPRRS